MNRRSKLDVALVTDNKQLDEVVVVGYGTQKRNSLTNSVSQIGGRGKLPDDRFLTFSNPYRGKCRV